MRIDNAKMPKSSFLSMEKDTSLIINKMLDNPRLKRLLYYTSKDALNRPNLNEDQSLDLINKNIKIVPKLYVDGPVLNYIIINFKNFTPSEHPERRDNINDLGVNIAFYFGNNICKTFNTACFLSLLSFSFIIVINI